MREMTDLQLFLTICFLSLGTAFTRFLPFLCFPENKEPPRAVRDLGVMLPPAAMGLLLVYCLKGVTPLHYPYGLPEAIAVAATVLLHLWKRSTLLSIIGGTLLYMVLVQAVFV